MKAASGLLFLLGLLFLGFLMFAWRSPVNPNGTPTPIALDANYALDCNDLIVLSLRSIQFNHINPQLFSNTNQAKALVFLTDGSSATEFNYHVQPVSVEVGSSLQLGRFHAAIDPSKDTSIYAWIIIADDNAFSDLGNLGASIFGSLSNFIVGSASDGILPGSGFVTGMATDYVLGQAVSWLKQDDIIGDVAFTLNDANDWAQGVHEYQTPNGALDLRFSVQRYICSSGIEGFHAPLSEPPATSSNAVPVVLQVTPVTPCASNSPTSRLHVGDMAIIQMTPGRFLFRRNGPAKSYPGIRYASGHMLRIIGGPACDGNIMYWNIRDVRNREGWMAESEIVSETQQGIYYLYPVDSTA